MTGPQSLSLGAAKDGVSPLVLANVVLQHRRVVAGCAATVFALVVSWVLLQGRTYSSSATFMPQVRSAPAGLTSIAAQFGIAAPGAEGTLSPAFYGDFLRSRLVLGGLAESTYSMWTGSDSSRGLFVDLYGIRARSDALRREAAIRALRELMAVSVDLRTGVIRLTVTTRQPDLSVQIANRTLELVNTFNLRTRQSQAGAERRFTEARLDEGGRELRQAEDSLQAFLQHNRDYRSSPELSFQQERLAREVAMRQQLYTSLAQAFEQARIEEVRDTPVITVVEQPEEPVQPDSRRLIVKGLLAMLSGAMIGVFLAVSREYYRRVSAQAHSEHVVFQGLLRATFGDLARPLRFLRRRRGASAERAP